MARGTARAMCVLSGMTLRRGEVGAPGVDQPRGPVVGDARHGRGAAGAQSGAGRGAGGGLGETRAHAAADEGMIVAVVCVVSVVCVSRII